MLNTLHRLAFDTETTGTDPEEARIITAAIVIRGGDQPDRDFNWIINPGVPIPPETTEIHGINDAKVQAEGVEPKPALAEIANMLAYAIHRGMPVVAFNLSYDWTVLDRELRRHCLPPMDERLAGIKRPPLIDAHVIDKQIIPRRKGKGQRKLKPTAAVYGIELDNWHAADADALAALLIAEAQFTRHPKLWALGPEGLFEAQKRWRAEQAASLQEYFRTKASPEDGGDPNKVIDGSWPVRPYPAEVTA
jgi:DNA polymerase-3 subunit epsilon